eukprot:753741-Hanusia_phi.AAC.4
MSLQTCNEDSKITTALTSPRSLEACERQGYSPEQLLYRSEEEFFDVHAGREISCLRYEHAEQRRQRRLRDVLGEYAMVCREGLTDFEDGKHQAIPPHLISLSTRSYEKEFEILKLKLKEQIADVIREDLRKKLTRQKDYHSSPAGKSRSLAHAADAEKPEKEKPPPLVRKQSENAARMQKEREEQQKRNIQVKEERRLAAIARKKHELQEENERKRAEFKVRLASAQESQREHQQRQETMLEEKMTKNEIQRRKFEEERREEIERRKQNLLMRQGRVQQAISDLDSLEAMKVNRLNEKDEEVRKRLYALRQNRGANSELRKKEAEYKEQRRREVLTKAESDKEARISHLVEKQDRDERQMLLQRERRDRERKLHAEMERQRKQERMEAIERYRRMEEHKRKKQMARIEEETRAVQQRKSDMRRLHEFILAEKREREELKKLLIDSVNQFAMTHVWNVPPEVTSHIDFNEIKSAIHEEVLYQRPRALKDLESKHLPPRPLPPTISHPPLLVSEGADDWREPRNASDRHERTFGVGDGRSRQNGGRPRPRSAQILASRPLVADWGHGEITPVALALPTDHSEMEEEQRQGARQEVYVEFLPPHMLQEFQAACQEVEEETEDKERGQADGPAPCTYHACC